MNTSLLEDKAKRKFRAFHVGVVGWAKKEDHNEMLGILDYESGHQISHLLWHGE